MHARRVVSWLLGAWMAGGLCMITVATRNFAAVDRLLMTGSPEARSMIGVLGRDNSRSLLRYLASELNRWYFEIWEWAQFPLAAGVLLYAFTSTGSRLARVAAIVAALILVAERFALTPEIIRLGRLIDFVPPEASSLERTRFWRLHHTYSALELTKLLAVATLGIQLFVRSSRQDA